MGNDTSKPIEIYFFAISGVNDTLFSIDKSSESDEILIVKSYNKNSAIKTKTNTTATQPHKTNLVKLFQVSLWDWLSIKLFLSGFKFGVSFIDNVNSTSSSD